MSRAAEWAWILVAFLLLNLTSASNQPAHPREGLVSEGQVYHAMAASFPRQLPPQGIAPFVYRFGTPLLAAAIAKSRDWVISAGFDRINIVFNLIAVVFFARLLQQHVGSVFARLLVLAAFVLEPHSPVRLAYFHPLSVDPATMAFLMAGLVAIDWFHERPSSRNAAALAALVAIGVLFHEVMLIVAVAALFFPATNESGVRARWANLEKTGAWMPLVGGLATLVAVRAWVLAAPPSLSLAADAVRGRSVLQFVVAWFLVFGPLLVVPLFFWRRTVEHLRRVPANLVWIAALGVIALLNPGETERYLVFASPVVWMLIARSMSWTALGPGASAMAGLLFAQALSSRIFTPIGGPISPPRVGTEIWERLGWAQMAETLSDANMWSQSSATGVFVFYGVWYGLIAAFVIGLLRTSERDLPSRLPEPEPELEPRPARAPNLRRPLPQAVKIVAITVAAMAPVVWLALSRFYWTHFEQPGPGYLLYNLARLWLMVVLLAAFWSTGARLSRSAALIDNAFSGAAAWSIGIVLLAVAHVFYVWLVLPLLAVAVGVAVADLLAMPRPRSSADWGLASILLRLWVLAGALTLLVPIAIWGNFGGDNDVPGNYLPYYESVLTAHTDAPNQYWVHFFASKGDGLAFLATALSDVQGSALVAWIVIVMGAGLLWRLADRSTALGRTIGLLAAGAYFLFYAAQGAFAKPHIIRNLFVVYLIVSCARRLLRAPGDGQSSATARLLVIVAVVILSPLASLALLPIQLIALAMLMLQGRREEAWRGLIEPLAAIAATIVVCTYNYLEVGIPELHSMPSVIGRWANLERFSRWADPGLVYIDDRLLFLQRALGDTVTGGQTMMLSPPRPWMDVIGGMLNPGTIVFLAAAAVIAAIAWFAVDQRRRAQGTADPAMAAGYLLIVLLIIAAVQKFSGGPGFSLYRVTSFGGPVALALGMVLLTATTPFVARAGVRRALAGIVALAAALSVAVEYPVIAAQRWRDGIGFIAGATSYAGIDSDWDTDVGARIARAVAPGERIELLSFLPGFSAVPASPFQRPDGTAYLREYTTVLYGSPGAVADVYAKYGIKYFAVDVAKDSSVLWSGFSPMFEPESIRSRMRVAGHEQTDRLDLYLLATRDAGADAGDLEGFLDKWRVKLAAERAEGVYRRGYQNGRRADVKE
jgi:hypothetical protein